MDSLPIVAVLVALSSRAPANARIVAQFIRRVATSSTIAHQLEGPMPVVRCQSGVARDIASIQVTIAPFKVLTSSWPPFGAVGKCTISISLLPRARVLQ